MISECEGEKGNFLCGPEWRVKITTRADQRLEVQQVGREEGDTALLQWRPCAGPGRGGLQGPHLAPAAHQGGGQGGGRGGGGGQNCGQGAEESVNQESG